MRLVPRRPERLPDEVRERAGLGRRDRVLAHARATDDRWLLGTPDRLLLLTGDGVRRLPWDEIQSVDWEQDEDRLTISEVGSYGEERRRHSFRLEGEHALLLQLVRERVQASIVLQRKFPVRRRRGFTVIGRRKADGSIAWMVEYDPGIDPDDPEVSRRAEHALATARNDVGE